MQTTRPKRFTTRMAAALLLGALLMIAGCSPKAATPVVIVEPALTGETAVEGFILNSNLSTHLVSPDGSYFLAVRNDGYGSYLGVFPSDLPDQETLQEIPVESVDREWLLTSWFSYEPLGWISDTEFVYAKLGMAALRWTQE